MKRKEIGRKGDIEGERWERGIGMRVIGGERGEGMRKGEGEGGKEEREGQRVGRARTKVKMGRRNKWYIYT